MGSRAVAIVCRDADGARRRFGVRGGETGMLYTRTGRSFFADDALQAQVLERLREALGAAGLWDELGSDWVCVDCELMPWSVKAQELLRTQYAAVGAAAVAFLGAAKACLDGAAGVGELAASYGDRVRAAERFVETYRRYCWPVGGVDDLRLAPFQLLAGEGRTYLDRPHDWHMQTLHRLAAARPGWLVATSYRLVDTTNVTQVDDAIRWWTALTGEGGEGIVVKPRAGIAHGKRGLLQPAIKCRGPEYLRIIYGPEYSLPANLERLRRRGLAAKRSLALREFSLGAEALERFVRREPLRRVHECVFGVLALESEPVDPRL